MSFYGVTDIWTYVIGALGVILLPGPNSLFVLSVASARGVKAGWQSAWGVFVGDSILLALTALGAAGLLRAHPAMFMVIKTVGAAYLAWVGLNLAWGALKKWKQDAVESVPSARADPAVVEMPEHLARPFQRALIISLLNPKAILFLLSFFVQFIDPQFETPAIPFLILSAILMAFSVLYLFTLIVAGARLAESFSRRQRLSAGLSGAVGGLFVWFGAKLATASLH